MTRDKSIIDGVTISKERVGFEWEVTYTGAIGWAGTARTLDEAMEIVRHVIAENRPPENSGIP